MGVRCSFEAAWGVGTLPSILSLLPRLLSMNPFSLLGAFHSPQSQPAWNATSLLTHSSRSRWFLPFV